MEIKQRKMVAKTFLWIGNNIWNLKKKNSVQLLDNYMYLFLLKAMDVRDRLADEDWWEDRVLVYPAKEPKLYAKAVKTCWIFKRRSDTLLINC